MAKLTKRQKQMLLELAEIMEKAHDASEATALGWSFFTLYFCEYGDIRKVHQAIREAEVATPSEEAAGPPSDEETVARMRNLVGC